MDLVIEIDSESGNVVEKIRIVPRIESDHLPVEIFLSGRGERKSEKRSKEKRKEVRLRWDGDKKGEYRKGMEDREGEVGRNWGFRRDGRF